MAKGKSIQELGIQFRQELQRYVTLHEKLFGTNFIPYLFPRPSRRVLFKIRGSFADFLKRNNLPLLNTFAYSILTKPGYGQPNRISAIYALSFVTPTVIRNILTYRTTRSTLIDSGFLEVLEKLIKTFHIKVKLNTNIKKIVRYKNQPLGKIHITHSEKSLPWSRTSYFDFLVVAVPMKNLFGVIDLSSSEKAIFGKQFTDTYFVSTLCDTPFGKRSDNPLEAEPEKLLQYDYEPYGFVDLYAAYNNITGPTYKQGLIAGGLDGLNIQTSLYLQAGRTDPRIPIVMKDIDTKFGKYLKTKRRTPYKIVRKFITPYFTRFPIPDLDKGILWDVLDLQGTHDTWYIGGSVTIDAAGAVIQYNDKLLRSYVPPGRQRTCKHAY